MSQPIADIDPCPTLRDLVGREGVARRLRDLAVPHEPVPAPTDLRDYQEAVVAWAAAEAAVEAHLGACPICLARHATR